MRLNWGMGIAAVYTAFALSTIGFVVFAMGHPVDLVADDYYARSLSYDHRMAGERNAGSLGDRLRVLETDEGRVLRIAMPAEWRGRVDGHVLLYRPADSAADRSWPLSLDVDGWQSVPIEGLVAGRWRLQLTWAVDDRPYYYEQVVDVRR